MILEQQKEQYNKILNDSQVHVSLCAENVKANVFYERAQFPAQTYVRPCC